VCCRTLDHDEFGLNQSKIINVIDLLELERVAGGKPLHTFPHPALVVCAAAVATPVLFMARSAGFDRSSPATAGLSGTGAQAED
jgi:hypothetical protein